eukprot:UN05574
MADYFLNDESMTIAGRCLLRQNRVEINNPTVNINEYHVNLINIES